MPRGSPTPRPALERYSIDAHALQRLLTLSLRSRDSCDHA